MEARQTCSVTFRTAVRLGIAFLACWPAMAGGQYTTPDRPADSPLWWPLIDGITAEELRAAHQEDALAERYQRAVESGKMPDCGPDYVPEMFADTGANPELMPLWFALNRFRFEIASAIAAATWKRNSRPNRAAAETEAPEPGQQLDRVASIPNRLLPRYREKLRLAGLSDAGIDALDAFFEEAMREVNRIEKLTAPAKAWGDDALNRHVVENPHMDVPGLGLLPDTIAAVNARTAEAPEARQERLAFQKRFETAVKESDSLTLSEMFGGDRANWQDWLAAVGTKSAEEAMILLLPQLRRDLSPGDWLALRRHLFVTYAALDQLEYYIPDWCAGAEDWYKDKWSSNISPPTKDGN